MYTKDKESGEIAFQSYTGDRVIRQARIGNQGQDHINFVQISILTQQIEIFEYLHDKLEYKRENFIVTALLKNLIF